MPDRIHDEVESRKTTSLSLSPVILWKKRICRKEYKKNDQVEIFLFQSNTKKSSCRDQKVISIQLFRERLSEKVHPTIPKGIVGDFKFTVLQRNLKEWHVRQQKEGQSQEQCIDRIPYFLSGLSTAHFFRQPFSK